MSLPSNLSKVLWGLDGLTDKEKRLIEKEFNATHVPSSKWILSDIGIVAHRLKNEGKISSEVPSYDIMKEILEKVDQAEKEEMERIRREAAIKKQPHKGQRKKAQKVKTENPVPVNPAPRTIAVREEKPVEKSQNKRRYGPLGYLRGFIRSKVKSLLK